MKSSSFVFTNLLNTVNIRYVETQRTPKKFDISSLNLMLTSLKGDFKKKIKNSTY